MFDPLHNPLLETLARREGAILAQLGMGAAHSPQSRIGYDESNENFPYQLVRDNSPSALSSREESIESLKSRAIALGVIAGNSRNVDEIEGALNELRALAASRSEIGRIAANYIASGTAHLRQVEREALGYTVMATQLAPAQVITLESDPLAYKLKEKGYFTAKQLAKFEAIDPEAMHEVVELDEEGKILRNADGTAITREVNGQELRDSISIHKGMMAIGDRRKTHEERAQAAKELDEFLDGHSNIDEDDTHEERREKKENRVRQAFRDVKGHSLHEGMFQADGTERPLTQALKSEIEELENESVAEQTLINQQSAMDRIESTQTPQEKNEKSDMSNALAQVRTEEQAAANETLTAILAADDEWGMPELCDVGFELGLTEDMESPALPAEVNLSTGRVSTRNR